nr:PAS domain-containing protein [Anaerolineae bacterium]
MTPSEIDPDIIRQIFEKLPYGVLIFDSRGTAVSANQEAARLLDYHLQEIPGLTREDFLALCQPDRLDYIHLKRALLGETAPGAGEYTFATVSRRLSARVIPLHTEGIPSSALLLREHHEWQAELISETAVDRLHSPLAFAASYCETLQSRLDEDWGQEFELQDLARITRESIGQAFASWEMLHRLHITNPEQQKHRAYRAIALPAVLQFALRDLDERGVPGTSRLTLDIPAMLPPVRASETDLRIGLSALLEGAANRQNAGDSIVIKAHDRTHYIQIDFIAEKPANALVSYLFDSLPCAIAEQVIIRHGGRIWFSAGGGGHVCSISLPVWKEQA